MEGSEHHFVPQFYLRAFSLDGRSTNCFNFRRERWIRCASVKHQCSRRNFHAFSPGLEKQLGDIEGRAATIIRRIRDNTKLPAQGSEDAAWLIAYTAFQRCRTPRATEGLTKVMAYLREIAGHAVPQNDVAEQHPVAVTLRAAGAVFHAARDLEFHLICNDSPIEFVTSDDPVALHNQYCEGITYTGVLGWKCRGLQAFLPLSPRELLVLFDPSVYRIGGSHKGSRITLICSANDAAMFNALQIHNADENVYFANAYGDGKAAQQCWAFAGARPRSRLTIIETERVRDTDTSESAIVGHFERLLPIQLETSIISIPKPARRVALAQRARMYRDATMARDVGAGPPEAFRYDAVTYPVKAMHRK